MCASKKFEFDQDRAEGLIDNRIGGSAVRGPLFPAPQMDMGFLM
jgi:hypothetical protein